MSIDLLRDHQLHDTGVFLHEDCACDLAHDTVLRDPSDLQ